jgi:phytol kinase
VWFTSQLTVLSLTTAFFLVLALTKVRGVLPSVHGVERRSSGALLYPVALGLLALLSGGRAVLFEAPLLVLAFADAAAAMVGVRYGRRVYTVNGCVRTVEGSAAFALTAFVVVAAVMGVHGAALLHSLAVALVVAPALTAVEAVATRGLDNLALPLAGFFLLALTLPAPPALLILLAVVSALLVLTALLAQALWLSPAPHSSPDGAE